MGTRNPDREPWDCLGYTIVTRNTRHFLPFAVDVSSPAEVAGQSA